VTTWKPHTRPSGGNPWIALMAAAGLLVLTGCDLLTAEDPLPLSASLEVDTASPRAGEPVRFIAEGTGEQLAAIILEFGDGGQDVQEFGGGRRASVQREWTYQEPGTYLASMEVVEFSGLRASAFVEIVVSGSGSP
jgi:hypothetical protein